MRANIVFPSAECNGPKCKPITCSGPGCSQGKCKKGATGCTPGEHDACKEPKTAETCTEVVRKIQTKRGEDYITTTKSDCATYTACFAEPTTVTTTKTIDDKHMETMNPPFLVMPTTSHDKLLEIANRTEDLFYSWDLERMGKSKETGTDAPRPTDKNGNPVDDKRNPCHCGELGCSADSPPCCSKGDCKKSKNDDGVKDDKDENNDGKDGEDDEDKKDDDKGKGDKDKGDEDKDDKKDSPKGPKPKCECSENGCTGPPCCASGDCDPDEVEMPDTPDPPPPFPEPKVRCFDKGARVPRSDMMKAVSKFCTIFKGKTLDYDDPKDNEIFTWRGSQCHPLGCMSLIELTLTAKKGCKYKIDGDSASDECGYSWRQPIDKCDQTGTQNKQGGEYETDCAIWKIDPIVKPVVGKPKNAVGLGNGTAGNATAGNRTASNGLTGTGTETPPVNLTVLVNP